MNKSYLQEKIFYFQGLDKRRNATISFRFNKSIEKWSFSKCSYNTLFSTYNIDDWTFLRDLSIEVITLIELHK